MDYMREINAFYQWLDTNPISDSARNLWHALMHVANRAGWAEEFTVAMSVLESKTGLSRSAVYRARNELKASGRAAFWPRGGNQCAVYRLHPLVWQGDTQKGTREGRNPALKQEPKRTQPGTITQTVYAKTHTDTDTGFSKAVSDPFANPFRKKEA